MQLSVLLASVLSVYPMDAESAAAEGPRTASGAAPVWVYFSDKGCGSDRAQRAAVAALAETYDPRAVARRRLRRTAAGLFDERDLPIAAAYREAVLAGGARARVESRWLNALSVLATPQQADWIAALPFVTRVEPVVRGRRAAPRPDEAPEPCVPPPHTRGPYGLAEAQLAQINLIALHSQGYRGQGVVVGVLDTGFNRIHNAFSDPNNPLVVVAEHDFINNDGNTGIEPNDPNGQHRHGTWILGTLAAYQPDTYQGGAYRAHFILCKTEDVSSETPIEEDYYVAGLEFIEQHGGDMATSSLGYIDWYTQGQLNGATAVTSVAVSLATANGVICVTAAGNSGHDADPATSHLLAPADAFDVIACGAVNDAGVIAEFSSDGPSADGRVKPEVLARGVDVSTISSISQTNYTTVSGTSLSTPLVAGAVASLLSAHPTWSVAQMRAYLLNAAGDFAATHQTDPLRVRGYGLVNAVAASAMDCDGDSVRDDLAIAANPGLDLNRNGVPDACEPCVGDANRDQRIDQEDLDLVLFHFGEAVTPRTSGDVDGDGVVGQDDLDLVLFGFGCLAP